METEVDDGVKNAIGVVYSNCKNHREDVVHRDAKGTAQTCRKVGNHAGDANSTASDEEALTLHSVTDDAVEHETVHDGDEDQGGYNCYKEDC